MRGHGHGTRSQVLNRFHVWGEFNPNYSNFRTKLGINQLYKGLWNTRNTQWKNPSKHEHIGHTQSIDKHGLLIESIVK